MPVRNLESMIRVIRRLLVASVLVLATFAPAPSMACHDGAGCPGCKHECASETPRGCEVPGSANGLGDTLALAARVMCD